MAIKLLISGFENTGKSTIASQLKDALVINFDKKEYGFPVPHVNIKDYEGMEAVTELITEKLEAYVEKFGNPPKAIVIDTVTQMYASMQKFNDSKYNGFDIHKHNNKDTLEFNEYIENVLLPNDISVIIVAHTVFDADSGRHIIPATGAFAKAGSWLSVTNEACYIEKKANKRIVHFTTMKYPCRSTLSDIAESQDMEQFDINAFVDKLIASKVEAADFVL